MRRLHRQLLAAFGRGQVSNHALHLNAWCVGLHGGYSLVHRCLRAAVDHNVCTSLSQRLGNRQANASSGTRDDGSLTV